MNIIIAVMVILYLDSDYEQKHVIFNSLILGYFEQNSVYFSAKNIIFLFFRDEYYVI
jgi:hypothetical protein